MVDLRLHQDCSLLCETRLCRFLFGSRFIHSCRDGLVCLSLVSIWWHSLRVFLCVTRGCCNVCLCDSFLGPVRGFGETWLISFGDGGRLARKHLRGEEREGGGWGKGLDGFGPRLGVLGCPTLVLFPPRWQSSLTTRTSLGGVITVAATICMHF
jgi:hypothetical protein